MRLRLSRGFDEPPPPFLDPSVCLQLLQSRIENTVNELPTLLCGVILGHFNGFINGHLDRDIVKSQEFTEGDPQNQLVDDSQTMNLPVPDLIFDHHIEFSLHVDGSEKQLLSELQGLPVLPHLLFENIGANF